MRLPNVWLAIAGVASALIWVLHVAIIAGGPSWYRFFGAGEGMARLAEHGSPLHVVITASISAVFLVFALYAFMPLPFRVPVLWTIAAVFLLRGLLVIPTLLGFTPLRMLPTIKPHDPFTLWSSLVSFTLGVVYALGTVHAMRE